MFHRSFHPLHSHALPIACTLLLLFLITSFCHPTLFSLPACLPGSSHQQWLVDLWFVRSLLLYPGWSSNRHFAIQSSVHFFLSSAWSWDQLFSSGHWSLHKDHGDCCGLSTAGRDTFVPLLRQHHDLVIIIPSFGALRPEDYGFFMNATESQVIPTHHLQHLVALLDTSLETAVHAAENRWYRVHGVCHKSKLKLVRTLGGKTGIVALCTMDEASYVMIRLDYATTKAHIIHWGMKSHALQSEVTLLLVQAEKNLR